MKARFPSCEPLLGALSYENFSKHISKVGSCIKSIVWNKDLILQHHILKHSINHLNYVSQIFSSRSSFVSKNSLQDINYREMDMQFFMRLVILLIESNLPKYCEAIFITPRLLQFTNTS